MTTLVLSVVRGPGDEINQARHISSGEFIVGRGDDNDWVLADPNHLLSTEHCVFQQDNCGWSVSDTGHNGLMLVQGTATVPIGGSAYRLAAGDRLRIGSYDLAIDLQEDEASFGVIFLQPFADCAGGLASRIDRMPPPATVPPIAKGRSDPSGRGPAVTSRRRATGAAGGAAGGNAVETVRPIAARPALAAYLAGLKAGSLPTVDIAATRQAAILPGVVSTLRATVRSLRWAHEHAVAGERAALRHRPNPLIDASDDHEATAWLLLEDRDHGPEPDQAIHEAFQDLRLHHACLAHAGRACAREIFTILDPDEPDRVAAPVWLDLIPGWRQARLRTIARRRYRRLGVQLDRMLERTFERTYAKAWNETRINRDIR